MPADRRLRPGAGDASVTPAQGATGPSVPHFLSDSCKCFDIVIYFLNVHDVLDKKEEECPTNSFGFNIKMLLEAPDAQLEAI